MAVKRKWKITHVRNRLGDLLKTKGGISRDDAVAEAVRRVEMERETSVADIVSEIASLESLIQAGAGSGRGVSEADLRLMLRKAVVSSF